MSKGYITQIIGPVLDVVFPDGNLPKIYNAITVTLDEKMVTCEVQQLLGDNKVRAVSMSATDGLKRGIEVIDTGSPISVPVGPSTLGRIFNILGVPVDNGLNIPQNVNKYSPAYARIIAAKPRATTSANIRLGGVYR